MIKTNRQIIKVEESDLGTLRDNQELFWSDVTSIGDWAFVSCTNLKTITIPKIVKSIGKNVFGSCNNLESVMLECEDGLHEVPKEYLLNEYENLDKQYLNTLKKCLVARDSKNKF